MNWTWLYLSFEGRISRKDYGLGFLLLGFARSALEAMRVFLHLAIWPIGLVLLLPMAALVAKRLHDLGFSLVIAIGPAAAMAAFIVLTWDRGGKLIYTDKAPPTAADIPALCFFAVLIVFTTWLGLAPGARQPNAYGERIR